MLQSGRFTVSFSAILFLLAVAFGAAVGLTGSPVLDNAAVAQAGGKVPGSALGNTSDSELWRAVRRGARDARRAFVIDGDRTFEADPRFGLIVLSETASKALSPGVNDPGTAIDVLGTSLRILAGWSTAARAIPARVTCPRLHVPPIAVEDLVCDAFRWIARDGAGQLEVQIRLQKALRSLAAHDPVHFGAAAQAMSHEAFARAKIGLALPGDVEILERFVLD